MLTNTTPYLASCSPFFPEKLHAGRKASESLRKRNIGLQHFPGCLPAQGRPAPLDCQVRHAVILHWNKAKKGCRRSDRGDVEGCIARESALVHPWHRYPRRRDPVPIFTMTVSAQRIAYIQFSGPREGEYLAADEVRFAPIADGDQQ